MESMEKDSAPDLAKRFANGACSGHSWIGTMQNLGEACNEIKTLVYYDISALKVAVESIFELARGIGSLRTSSSEKDVLFHVLTHSSWDQAFYPCLKACFFEYQ